MKTLNNRQIGTIALILMLLICGLAAVRHGMQHKGEDKSAYREQLCPAPPQEDPLCGIDEGRGFIVDETFSTHLPLVILELPEGEPPISTEYNAELDAMWPIDGVEPYVHGTFYLIDKSDPSPKSAPNASSDASSQSATSPQSAAAGFYKPVAAAQNHITDTPAVKSPIMLKRRGNSSMRYEKAQWGIKLFTESGEKNDLDILGMGEEHEWILNGSLADKSLLRNYLAYRVASRIMPFVPDNQYCEVVLCENGTYRYQGVYLLGENIKQGPDRVNILDYKESNMQNSYLIRRDRIDKDGIMLYNYSRIEGLSKEYFGLIYPSKLKVSDEMISYVEEDLGYIEQVLYSDNDKIFNTYSEVIDVDSFVDYFLINEFFGSYDAGNNSTYAYKDFGGKLKMGPVWDFDGTMDNYHNEPISTADIAFQTKPWFDRLSRDKAFVRRLIKRYVNLRKDVLSDANIDREIDGIVDHLGPAIEREWSRWGRYYRGESEDTMLWLADYELPGGKVLHRNADRYEDEIYRIKTVLREHGNGVYEALVGHEQETEYNSDTDKLRGWGLLIVIAGFMIPAVAVSMK